MKRTFVLAACVALAAVLLTPAAQALTGQTATTYVVVLKTGVDPAAVARLHAANYGLKVDRVYSHAIAGYSASITGSRATLLANDENVDFIESDVMMYPDVQVLPWGIDKVEADLSSAKAGDGEGEVEGVHAYIIDSGIDTNHTDLNVVEFVNFVDPPDQDCNGHGTHVAGTVGAFDNDSDVVGMAPGVDLHAVKVFNCSGGTPFSIILEAVDWVTANAVKPAVANMSLGGPNRWALDRAVARSSETGIFYAISAGNDAGPACENTPARAGEHRGVMTVAATDINDNEAGFSSFGSCVDVWAPGVNVLSTRLGGGTISFSGTSMSAPHVSGAGALYLWNHPTTRPKKLEDIVKADRVKPGANSKDGRPIRRLDVHNF